MDLQYSSEDAGHLLGVWLGSLGFLALSTMRSGYSPILHPQGDRLLFVGLIGLVGLGAASSQLRDIALGVPMSVCGGLVVWIVLRQLLAGSVALTGHTVLTASGLVALGGLFVREGGLIATGRRYGARDSYPRTRWPWWLAAVVLLAVGMAGVP